MTGTKIKQISCPETVDRLAEQGYEYCDSLQVDKRELRKLPVVTIGGEPLPFFAFVENNYYYIFYGEGSGPDTVVCDVFKKEVQS